MCIEHLLQSHIWFPFNGFRVSLPSFVFCFSAAPCKSQTVCLCDSNQNWIIARCEKWMANDKWHVGQINYTNECIFNIYLLWQPRIMERNCVIIYNDKSGNNIDNCPDTESSDFVNWVDWLLRCAYTVIQSNNPEEYC